MAPLFLGGTGACLIEPLRADCPGKGLPFTGLPRLFYGLRRPPAPNNRPEGPSRPGSLAVTRGILVSFFSSAYLYA